MSGPEHTMRYIIPIEPNSEYPDFDKLAERLGVKPGEGDGLVRIETGFGRSYDLVALIHAFLDRVDKATS